MEPNDHIMILMGTLSIVVEGAQDPQELHSWIEQSFRHWLDQSDQLTLLKPATIRKIKEVVLFGIIASLSPNSDLSYSGVAVFKRIIPVSILSSEMIISLVPPPQFLPDAATGAFITGQVQGSLQLSFWPKKLISIFTKQGYT